MLAQTYSHFELIIADDGSTDDTERMVAQVNDARVRFLKFPHSGHTGIARNRGAAQARGKWLAFLDSDDLWVPGKLELQLKALQRSEASWCFGSYRHMGPVERKLQPITSPPDLTESILLNKTAVFIGTMLVTKNVFMLLGGFNETGKLRFRADLEFALRLSLHSQPVFVEETLTLVRVHPARSTSQLDRSFEYTFNAYEEFIHSVKDGNLRSMARARQAYQLSEAAANKKTSLKFDQRIKLLKASFGNDRLTHWLHCFWRAFVR